MADGSPGTESPSHSVPLWGTDVDSALSNFVARDRSFPGSHCVNSNDLDLHWNTPCTRVKFARASRHIIWNSGVFMLQLSFLAKPSKRFWAACYNNLESFWIILGNPNASEIATFNSSIPKARPSLKLEISFGFLSSCLLIVFDVMHLSSCDKGQLVVGKRLLPWILLREFPCTSGFMAKLYPSVNYHEWSISHQSSKPCFTTIYHF